MTGTNTSKLTNTLTTSASCQAQERYRVSVSEDEMMVHYQVSVRSRRTYLVSVSVCSLIIPGICNNVGTDRYGMDR